MSQPASPEQVVDEHPTDAILRPERIPHIWCPGCGLGTMIKAVAEAIERGDRTLDEHVVVSGIGCTGRAAGYVNTDSYHTTHGRGIAFATGVKVARPELAVTVLSGDGDLFNIGGNHFIHAVRRNLDLTVVCVNNFNYGMTGGQFGATTPQTARTATSPDGNVERPFNLPLLAASLGAPFVARWSTLHPRRLADAIEAAMATDGFGFVEVVSPCPPGFGKPNGFPQGLDLMTYFQEHCVVNPAADLRDVGIAFQGEDIVLGTFVDEADSRSYLHVREDLAGGDAPPLGGPRDDGDDTADADGADGDDTANADGADADDESAGDGRGGAAAGDGGGGS